MQTRSKTSITNLQQLQDLYLAMLRERAKPIYEPFVASGVLTKPEAESEVTRYYNRTKAILQGVYSYYEKYWNAYASLEKSSEDGFLIFLKHNQGRMSFKYNLVDIDVAFYIEKYSSLPPGSRRRSELRRNFMRKWRVVLTNDEFAHQMAKMDELCFQMEGDRVRHYERIRNRMGIGSAGRLSRLHLLLDRYSDDVVKCILDYYRISENNKLVRQIAELVGRSKPSGQKRFSVTCGINPEWTISRSQKSDINGVCEGNDLNALLPLEYCYATDDDLQGVFMRRWSQKQLQMFDYVSHTRQKVHRTSKRGGDVAEPDNSGPVIVCLDTSASMMGVPELVAKSLVFALVRRTTRQHRPLYIINFSENIETVSILDFERDFGKLVDFLTRSFYKGSDMNPAVEHAVEILKQTQYSMADLLLLSDFRLDRMELTTHADLLREKKHGTRIYAVSFFKDKDSDYLDLADRMWLYDSGADPYASTAL